MYLKRVEIHGFKSFADKVNFEFGKGLSVVVGPNGSGKSNISDAIRWVLGEQSAKSLRGAKMEDVIFAGSAKRRPVGMAEVSLTIDNSSGIFPLAFNEITVTRRVYRSGDSEYLINKSSCRLKDVHELFMDTGIGREGFSIIGQGRVEEILNSRPEDRRGLIEEVAGITKYRNRKREAVRKLDDTEQNLVRLADIIAELENQLGPLEEQSVKAREYQGLKTELDELELNLAVYDIEDLSSKLVVCRSQIGQLQDKILQSGADLSSMEADSAKLKHSLQGQDEQIYQAQSACHSLSSRIQQAEADLNLCRERTGTVAGQQERLETQRLEQSQKLKALSAEYSAEEAKLLILRQTRKELATALAKQEGFLAEQSLELGSAEGQLENLKSEVFELMSLTAQHNNQLTALKQQEENRRYRLGTLGASIEHKKKEAAELENSLEAVLKQADGQRQEINNLLFTLNKQQEEIDRCKARLEGEQAESAKLKESLQAVVSRLRLLKEMQRDYEGYNRSVKETMQAANASRLKGLCGVVAELVQAPAKLEAAVEVALGGSLQNLVARTEEDSKQAIRFLKEQKFGRATFLPLDVLKPGPRNLDTKVLNAPGVLGVAADLVQCEEQFKVVAEYLLGRILIVENLDAAVKVARLGGYKLRIVTLEGELLSPGGSMTGGSLQQRSTSLLGRNREISQLEEEEQSARQRLDLLKTGSENSAALLQRLAQALNQGQSQVKERELNLASLEAKRGNLNGDLERIRREQEQFALEYSAIEAELINLEQNQDRVCQERDRCQAHYDQLSQEIAAGQELIKEQGSAREKSQAEITDYKIKIAALEQQEKGLESALERYYQLKAELEEGLAESAREQGLLEQRKLEIASEINALKETLAELMVSESSAQSELENLRAERQQNFESLEAVEARERELRRELQQNQEGLHAAQVREARLETEIKAASTRLQEDLELEFDQAKARSKPIGVRRDAVMRINKLKQEIGSLGPVNLGAIDEYARVQERYEFLFAQQQDLIQAKGSLSNVISEMDRIMVERFGASFASIKEKFSLVFEELFGGGRAELRLTDPENLLETGIEIIAQPPGKKLQQLSLLSGGEKALTAIALLFAMLKVKPSPFCVLDEIEAALDEANVSRFAAYLKELVVYNQFVVISHRRGTMEAADLLYGVTMEDNGVSKLYSVKLADEDLAG